MDVRRDPQEAFTTQEQLDYEGQKEMKRTSLISKLEMALDLGDKDAVALAMSVISRTKVVDFTDEEVDLIVKIKNKEYTV